MIAWDELEAAISESVVAKLQLLQANRIAERAAADMARKAREDAVIAEFARTCDEALDEYHKGVRSDLEHLRTRKARAIAAGARQAEIDSQVAKAEADRLDRIAKEERIKAEQWAAAGAGGPGSIVVQPTPVVVNINEQWDDGQDE